MKKQIFVDIVAFLYVCLFLYTGISKLMAYDLTREQMAIMPLIGRKAALMTWFLPVSEIILAILIFLPKTKKMGLYAGTLLMAWFSIYVVYIMKYKQHLPCTCGGLLQSLSWPQHLAFNIGFVLLGITALSFMRKHVGKFNVQMAN